MSESERTERGAPGMYGGPGVLRRELRETGGADRGRKLRATLWQLKLALTRSCTAIESALYGRAIRQLRLPADPVFIVGHYRSGTTLLHKLLAADPRFGSVDTLDLLLPCAPHAYKRLARPILQTVIDVFGIRQEFFHDYRVRLDDPNEVEPLMLGLGSPWSSYWAYFCPRGALRRLGRYVGEGAGPEWRDAYGYFLRRAAWRSRPGLRLVVKDPINTGRVRALADTFPEARFVYVHRDPRRVVRSMWLLWRDTIEPAFCLQSVSDQERSAIVLGHYNELMESYYAEREALDPRALVELRYDDLMHDPIASVRAVYEHLDLGAFGEVEASIRRRWAEDRAYREAPLGDTPESLRSALTEVEGWCERLGYPC